MNEINFPTGDMVNEMTITTGDPHGTGMDYKLSGRSRKDLHPLRRRTRFAMCCWSILLVFSLACLCSAVLSIILIPGYGVKVGIPILLVGAGCCGVAIFCFYTSYAAPECRPDGQFPTGEISEDAALSQHQEHKNYDQDLSGQSDG